MAIIVAILCALTALAATVLAFIFVLPEKKREKLPKIGQMIHDLFNFKYLIIEKILQALYIFTTLFVFLYGFLYIFTGFEAHTYYSYVTDRYRTEYSWNGWVGFLIMILGPIVLRLVYEGLLMMVLLVKNVIQINRKLKNQNEEGTDASMFDLPKFTRKSDAPAEPAAPAQPVAPAQPAAPRMSFCTRCGMPLNANGKCPNCDQ